MRIIKQNTFDRKNLDKKPPGAPGATGNTRGPINRPGPRLCDLEVLGGRLAAIGDEFVLDHLSLVEGAQAGALDRGDVDEHVLVSRRRPDEAVALSRIEPFDGALLHRLSPRSVRTKDETRHASSACRANKPGVFGDPKQSLITRRAGAAKNSDCCANNYKKMRPKQGPRSFVLVVHSCWSRANTQYQIKTP